MLKQMPASDFANWQSFSQLEPFGARVDDMRFSALRAELANRHLMKGEKPYTTNDMLLTVARVKVIEQEQSVEQMYNLMKGNLSD